MKTAYSIAWEAFITSAEAQEVLSIMGNVSVYNENKLRVAFDAGWNASRARFAKPSLAFSQNTLPKEK